MTIEHEVLGIERGFWASAGDGSYYESQMHDDGLCLTPAGAMNKTATTAVIADSQPWETYDLGDVRIYELASDVAMLTYEASAKRSGAARYVALTASTYTRENGEWKLLVHQQTPIAGRR